AISFIGSYAVFQSRNSALEVRAVTEGMMPSVLASSDLVGQLKDVQLASLSMLNETDAQLMSQAGERLANGKNLLQQGLDFQLKHATGGAQQGLVEQSRETLDNYFAAIDSVMQFKQAGRADIAQATYFGNVVQYQNELEDIVQTLRVEKNRSKDVAVNTLNAGLSDTTFAIAAVSAISVALLTLIGVLLYRQIAGPISRMQSMMSEIASSQDFTRRLPVQRMDEVGHSIVAFNGMIEKIQQASAQLKQKTADMQA